MLALTLIEEIAAECNDPDYDWWLLSDWADYMDDAGKQLAVLKPSAYQVRKAYQLIAGSAQRLPDGTANYVDPSSNTLDAAVQLFQFPRNMGTDGLTPGTEIRTVSRDVMDSLKPGWSADTAAAAVQCVILDNDSPVDFDVYPPQPSSGMGWIFSIYGAIPPVITREASGAYMVPTAAATMPLSDSYLPAIRHYMKFRAFMKDIDVGADPAMAMTHFNTFVTLLGRKDLVETREYSEKTD